MKIIPDIKATFGDTYFLGFTEKKKFDSVANKKTEEIEGYVCKISSSELQEQIEVTVPITVAVNDIKFNQKVMLREVVIDPYARSSGNGSFAKVILRCSAKALSIDSSDKTAMEKNNGQK